MEKNMKENIYIYMHIYICITESLCCTAEIKDNTLNQLYFKNIFKNNLGGENIYYLKPQ